jgi:hypothetical protein
MMTITRATTALSTPSTSPYLRGDAPTYAEMETAYRNQPA